MFKRILQMYDNNLRSLQGGFAKCYEVFDMDDNNVYASKIVSKQLVCKSSQKEKMTQEIKIHQSLHHRNVVGFYNFFDDKHNVYMLLELCKKRVSATTTNTQGGSAL